ncbi:LysM peptidoglycan-binding domain-containing protein [Desulfosporosinus sp. FKA]|uniref:LysM peptidoglycan-binding domain-containing protein n=1 Tax=Desulfosporosinus sp. FKA TaxID=1969834 RepID=UPI000B49FBEE|nr:LysM peptidoglycan-binding domain-containing protein [Desulfosporosinus sp. FKA]
MELRSVAYNPALGMGGMSGMSGMAPDAQGMAGMQGAQAMPGMMGAQAMPGMMGAQAMPGMMGMPEAGMHQGMYADPCCPMPCPPMSCPPEPMVHSTMPEPTPAHEVYVVKKGDTVYKIAKRYGTTMQAIILANDLRNPDLIYPGQILFIPGASAY